MLKLNSLHLSIAEVLINCAKNKKTICYSDLCNKISYPSPRAVGKELEKISLVTYEHYKIFLSVLVVTKESQQSLNPTPGTGFYTMYAELSPTTNLDMDEVIKKQREMAFQQDWSTLLKVLRTKVL